MRPLRELFVVQREPVAKEEKTSSGLILIKQDTQLAGFDSLPEVIDSVVKQAMQHSGEVKETGPDCGFVKKGKRVIYKKYCEKAHLDDDKVIVSENDALAIIEDGKIFIGPEYALVKITKESRDSLFSKKIRRDDGTYVDLFLTIPKSKDEDAYSLHAVSSGEVKAVGYNVKNVFQGDIAILDYMLDNDESIIVGYEGSDKLIAVKATSVRHKDTNIAYQTRKSRRDQVVWKKGEFDVLSKLYGVVRGDELISRDPYVFLNHESTLIKKATESGIVYEERHSVYQREILAVCLESERNFDLGKGDKVMIRERDVFECFIIGKTISVIHDEDILLNMSHVKKLVAV